MFEVAVHLPVWRRPDVFEVVVQQLNHINSELCSWLRMVPFIISSPDDPDLNVSMCMRDFQGEWHLVVAPNHPLGAKMNAGWQAIHAARSRFGAVMNLGSDDLISPGLVEGACGYLQAGTMDVVGIGQALFMDWNTGRCGLVSPKVPFGYGPGRFYSIRAMDLMQWRLADDRQNKMIERNIDGKLKRLRLPCRVLNSSLGEASKAVAMADLKSAGNIWSYDTARSGRKAKGQWQDLPEGTVQRLFPGLDWPIHLRAR